VSLLWLHLLKVIVVLVYKFQIFWWFCLYSVHIVIEFILQCFMSIHWMSGRASSL